MAREAVVVRLAQGRAPVDFLVLTCGGLLKGLVYITLQDSGTAGKSARTAKAAASKVIVTTTVL